MSVNFLQTLSTVFFVLSAVTFLISLALFFVLDVSRLVGDITGITARKAIENIRKGNEITGDKAYKPSPVNKSRGKLTDKISASGQIVPNSTVMGVSTGTEKLYASELHPQEQNASGNETTALSITSNETTLLSQNAPVATNSAMISENGFVLDLEMDFIGSVELIE